MFCLSTEKGNTLNLADCVLNSLEIESPFISFRNDRIGYNLSYYFDNKALVADYYGTNKGVEKTFNAYWMKEEQEGGTIAGALSHQAPVSYPWEQMPEAYFEEATAAILAAMDGFSKLVEELA